MCDQSCICLEGLTSLEMDDPQWPSQGLQVGWAQGVCGGRSPSGDGSRGRIPVGTDGVWELWQNHFPSSIVHRLNNTVNPTTSKILLNIWQSQECRFGPRPTVAETEEGWARCHDKTGNDKTRVRLMGVLPRSWDDHAGDFPLPSPSLLSPLQASSLLPHSPFFLSFSFPSLPISTRPPSPSLPLKVGPLKSR